MLVEVTAAATAAATNTITTIFCLTSLFFRWSLQVRLDFSKVSKRGIFWDCLWEIFYKSVQACQSTKWIGSEVITAVRRVS